jgi:hypothetical protein
MAICLSEKERNMRTKTIVKGLSNSQKVRVILDGVGFYTTIKGVDLICTTNHRVAALLALDYISKEKIRGYGGQLISYDSKMNRVVVNYQVDLV